MDTVAESGRSLLNKHRYSTRVWRISGLTIHIKIKQTNASEFVKISSIRTKAGPVLSYGLPIHANLGHHLSVYTFHGQDCRKVNGR